EPPRPLAAHQLEADPPHEAPARTAPPAPARVPLVVVAQRRVVGAHRRDEVPPGGPAAARHGAFEHTRPPGPRPQTSARPSRSRSANWIVAPYWPGRQPRASVYLEGITASTPSKATPSEIAHTMPLRPRPQRSA